MVHFVTPGNEREFLPWVKGRRAVWVSPCYKAIYSLCFERFAAPHCCSRRRIDSSSIHSRTACDSNMALRLDFSLLGARVATLNNFELCAVLTDIPKRSLC
jgi:hypothetical protein